MLHHALLLPAILNQIRALQILPHPPPELQQTLHLPRPTAVQLHPGQVQQPEQVREPGQAQTDPETMLAETAGEPVLVQDQAEQEQELVVEQAQELDLAEVGAEQAAEPDIHK